ncbi:diaminohydroxyphosphoribosylaminopyrimidine deaminase [Filimonas lacunae]|nr:diaminohydroxyphosphoribosylaminopyrimidine deaminase [Filimonas lacunae]
MFSHESYMQRCLQLAKLGAGRVAPNPMVGSVLVYENRIIGEGYHEVYGKAHAEVNCINSVRPEDAHLIPLATIYVSLEPCAHFGKTPPCADLIIKHGIQTVVVGCRDPFKEVNGKGIEKLQQAGVTVITGVLEQDCLELNKRFFTFHTRHRPYMILKWAKTADDKIASYSNTRLIISNEFTNRLVHKWRTEETGILVGTQTARVDNPQLTARLWQGKHPVRMVIDKDLKLPSSLHLMQGSPVTIVFNTQKHSEELDAKLVNARIEGVYYYQVNNDTSLLHQVLNACYLLQIQSVLVEGGAYLQQSIIAENCWDEARVITNEQLWVKEGLAAPKLETATPVATCQLQNDRIDTYINNQQ